MGKSAGVQEMQMSSRGQKMVKPCSKRSGRERSFGKMGLTSQAQGDALGFGGSVKQEALRRRVLRDCLSGRGGDEGRGRGAQVRGRSPVASIF